MSYPMAAANEIEVIDGIKVVGLLPVFDAIYKTQPGQFLFDIPAYIEDDWDAQNEKLRDWCAEHNFHYYARCKEDFFTHEGVEEAKAAGKAGVILDNLS